ncbi:Retrovirus-related Pol polyprotein from transposon TNT 1-94 [Vitis vinifera]|uniref:Retrovirus-related Pol polyprotein from transposon TNT 1-94 n=1 Tax=Vitis vinifera TaxID=29760 RepID=A0A438JGM4_VITVI|nr:Retrovirus-related Pol polyprotein from transposon TNT 1-94 [Vitis vinifera]
MESDAIPSSFATPSEVWFRRQWRHRSSAKGGAFRCRSGGATPAPLKCRLQRGLGRYSSVVCSAVQAPLTAPLEVLERATQDALGARLRGRRPAACAHGLCAWLVRAACARGLWTQPVHATWGAACVRHTTMPSLRHCVVSGADSCRLKRRLGRTSGTVKVQLQRPPSDTAAIAYDVFNAVVWRQSHEWRFLVFFLKKMENGEERPSKESNPRPQASSISANVNNIPMLNGTNFKKWKEHVIIVLGCMDLDFALREDRSSDLTSVSTAEQRSTMEKWERSNHMSLMIMKHSIPKAIRGAIPEETQAKAFLDQIANRFAANEKVETSTILSKLVSMRYKGKENIREYIMEMSNLVTRLKPLKLELSEDILVHLVLISLPTQFRFGTNKKRKRDNKGKQTAISGTSKQKEKKKQDKEITCFFCKKTGHMKKTCTKYATWREKKGTLLNFVCLEINLAVVPTDTWWIDMGATTHISVTMQGCLRSRMPTDGERYIYVGNGNKATVKAIGLFRLQLDSGYICGPFPTPSWNGQQYFITFIEDYSRYGYLYLIHEKSQSLDVFKNFKAEVENQLSKKIKAVRSDHGGTSSQNGVAERRNRTLKDMGCPAEARPYKPNEKKLDSRTVSCYFVGYFERSRGFKFYDPSTRSFFETGNAKFIEDVELSGRESLRKSIIGIQDTPEIPLAQVMEPIQVHQEVTQQPQELQVQVPLRRSTRERRSTISDDYVVYLQEHEFDMGLEDDPISVSQVKQSSDSEKWIEAMKDKMKSMKDNGVWDLVELPKGVKPIGCKWIFKTKWDSKGNIVRYKARLVAKGFTQKEGIDYKETFSPVSSKDSFRIIMTLVAHYDLELHQMDVKTAFLDSNIDETIYMENTVDQCIYLKFSGSKFIILVLYVDDILLASSDVGLLHETKRFLSSKFDMKDLGNASFVLGIQIHRDHSRGILGLSQKAYIDKALSRFGMSNCAPGDMPVAKDDKFSLHQCPKNELEKKDMERFPYASAIGSLMYAQVCTRPDIAYIVGMLGRYLSNPGMDHWKKAKRVMRYLQRTKDYMLTYRRSSHLEIVGYLDSDFAGCLDSRRSTSGYIFMLVGGAVSWKSVKQTLIASSTIEAEFIACYEASNHGIWLWNFVTQLRIVDGIEKPLRINCDNKAAELYSKNNRSSSKSKHIDIKFLVVKERVQSLQVSIERISTNFMIADPLTKGLPPKVYHEHVAHMGVVHIDDVSE